MKNILFPTDYSEAATHAFKYAVNVAKKIEAGIIVFHAYQIPTVAGGEHLPLNMQEVYARMHEDEQKKLEEHMPLLRAIAESQGAADTKLEQALEFAPAIDSILRIALHREVELIVMGTKGASGLREIFIGSIAGEVLEKANCPVLAIPAQAAFDGAIDHIGVCTTFREEDGLALEKVLEFAKHFNAKVTCVNVDLSHTDGIVHAMDVWEETYGGEGKLSFKVIEGNDFEHAMAGFISAENIDMLGMLTRKRTLLQELFTYNRTKKMSYHSKTPILALPLSGMVS